MLRDKLLEEKVCSDCDNLFTPWKNENDEDMEHCQFCQEKREIESKIDDNYDREI